MSLATLPTPALLVDTGRMRRNIVRMQERLDALGVRFRPHAKTPKSLPVLEAQRAAGAAGVTVSTLREAEACFAGGITDILYGVGIAEEKLPRVVALRRRGCDLKLITDNIATVEAVARFARRHGERFELWLEIDTDGHRSGIPPEGDRLLEVARAAVTGDLRLGGVMTHAGSSYQLHTPEALRQRAEEERAGCVRAAERLRAAGIPCEQVSVGSTPTALSAASLDGVTEVRAGVYVFFDLVMANIGVCTLDEIALGVLGTVIGHQEEKGWAIVDAGWMAMSRDRGTQAQPHDYGYGQVCDLDGVPLPGYLMTGANQEHGIIARSGSPDPAIATRFPVGSRVRILPNHACATAAQYPGFHAIGPDGDIAWWERFDGW